MDTRYVLWCRKRIIDNRDPERRCYNGCFAEAYLVWSPWEVVFSRTSKESLEDSAVTFKRINKDQDYLVLPEGAPPPAYEEQAVRYYGS